MPRILGIGLWDHPRSRGVYGAGLAAVAARDGSSPLARGLPSAIMISASGSGIIPARAGFTGSGRGRRSQTRDHPRSRGVYDESRRDRRGVVGSSPLARGLPAHRDARVVRRRIIPARAGFTPRGYGPARAREDHPRSRGVYWPVQVGEAPGARIIPARAGFTSGRRRGGGRGSDHPRSRGVYTSRYRPGSPKWGSSPLARGLPRGNPSHYGREGIIPARAGFTRTTDSSEAWAADHPRSRGVYLSPPRRRRLGPGSSPLARGLRASPPPDRSWPRIIPARAGFTRFFPERWEPHEDHPRSRGVYTVDGTLARNISGSSPLARGLRIPRT